MRVAGGGVGRSSLPGSVQVIHAVQPLAQPGRVECPVDVDLSVDPAYLVPDVLLSQIVAELFPGLVRWPEECLDRSGDLPVALLAVLVVAGRLINDN